MQKTREHRRSVCVFVFQSALQSSPWGLMQALEQQVGELRIDTDEGCCDGAQGDTGDSRPSSGTSTVLNLFCDLSSHVYVVKSSQVGFFYRHFNHIQSVRHTVKQNYVPPGPRCYTYDRTTLRAHVLYVVNISSAKISKRVF